jgi:hypothetical protein
LTLAELLTNIKKQVSKLGAHAYNPVYLKRLRYRRLQFKASPGQKSKLWDPISKVKKTGSGRVCTCYSSYDRMTKIGRSQSRPAWGKCETLSQKLPETKGLEVGLQVEHLSSKHEALSSSSHSPPPKKE